MTSAVSPAQLAANQRNAQLSTGPTSDIGKAKSCLNAVKTGLTGRTVLLPSEDAAEYERHIRAYEKELEPVGQIESDLVQSIADTTWRLSRIPALEMAIFAQGHLEFADSFDEHDPSLRSSLIELQTFTKYEKQLRNLHLQEGRLGRRREKETAELRRLQAERNAKQADPAPNGFEFSSPSERGDLSEPRAQQAVTPPSEPRASSEPRAEQAVFPSSEPRTKQAVFPPSEPRAQQAVTAPQHHP